MSQAVHYIEGIGPQYARLLAAAGVTTVERLLQTGASRQGRMVLSRKTGISTKLLLKWVNMCDLFRVRGIAGHYARLLEASGVDTMQALCRCDSGSLLTAMGAANGKRQLVRTLPNSKRISGWIKHARSLRVLVTN